MENLKSRRPPERYEETSHLKFRPVHLTDREYAHAIQTFIIVCADAIIIDRRTKSFFLSKRRAHPYPSWWIVGGRIRAGEPETLGVRKNFARETSLTISEDRFKFQTMVRMLWKDRAQPPTNTPCDTISYWFTVELTAEERSTAASHLDPREYEGDLGLQAFNLKRLRAERIHPAIISLYRKVFPS